MDVLDAVAFYEARKINKTYPKHLGPRLTEPAWNYIVEVAGKWYLRYLIMVRPAGISEIQNWHIINWMISWAMNPNMDNKEFLADSALRYLYLTPTDVMEVVNEIYRLSGWHHEAPKK